MTQIFPTTADSGTGPNFRESSLTERLSPRRNTFPGGTNRGESAERPGSSKYALSSSSLPLTNTLPFRISMISFGRPITRFTKSSLSPPGFLNTTTSPRLGLELKYESLPTSTSSLEDSVGRMLGP